MDCPTLVEQALDFLDTNCSGMGLNSVCYDYNRLEATFTEEVDEGFFSLPGDLTDIEILQTIITAPFDLENEEWGVAMMKIQANVPNTIPGQAVIFVMMGDTALEN